MKVHITLCIDTSDPRFRRLIDLVEELAGDEPAAPPAPSARRTDRGGGEDVPHDGRQLLGWASKQIPDLKSAVLAYGRKKGLNSRILEWTPQQVEAAYHHARQAQDQQWGGPNR